MLPSHRDLALLTARSRPFSSPDSLYELTWDGYRVLALVGDVVRLVSRQGRDMTAAFPEVAQAVGKLPRGTALDGELVILDNEGKPTSSRVENNGERHSRGGSFEPSDAGRVRHLVRC